jgi:hypothetical protein
VNDTEGAGWAALSLDSIVTLREDVATARFDDDLMLVDTASDRYHAPGSTGSRIIGLLDPARTVRDIVAALCAEYDVDPNDCAADVLAFLVTLGEANLVVARLTFV